MLPHVPVPAGSKAGVRTVNFGDRVCRGFSGADYFANDHLKRLKNICSTGKYLRSKIQVRLGIVARKFLPLESHGCSRSPRGRRVGGTLGMLSGILAASRLQASRRLWAHGKGNR